MFPAFQMPTYTYKAKVVKIIDGDTMDVKIDVGFNTHIFKRIRLLGVDTWELRGSEKEKGQVAKAYVENIIMTISQGEVYIQTEMDAEGKYGRLLAWVWSRRVGEYVCLNEDLLEKGHGVPM